MVCAIRGLDPASYVRSSLHSDERLWPEKNCYIDIWLELIHALKLEPRAILPFVVALDFEGDQWTFFKPPHGELYELYGLDTQELTVWKPLIEHAVEHLPAGRLISTEADSYWLPDTSGTDYRRNHVKSTIVMNAIDVESGTLDYFHNTGYYRLQGEDFRQLFRLDLAPDPTFLPLYAEFVRTERVRALPGAQLALASRRLLARHVERRPRHNPVRRFGERFEQELPRMQQQGLAHYHQWAFSNLRQLGAAFELAAIHLRWLAEEKALQAGEVAARFENISATCKSLILKGARSVNSRKPLDLATPSQDMAAAWDMGMARLQELLADAG